MSTFDLSKEQKKETIKKHLIAVASSSFHVGKGHNSIEGFKELYTNPQGQESAQGHHDDALIEECITELKADGTFA